MKPTVLKLSVICLVTLSMKPAASTDILKIGMTVSLSGVGASSGQFQYNGAKLAVEEVNSAGGVLGRPIDLVVEDDQTTNPGAVLAFSKLAGNLQLPAFIGEIRSTQIHAMSPEILKIAKPVMIGGTDPTLTHSGNPWLFRFRPNDLYSARVMANFGVQALGKRKWAIVHSTDAFGTAGMKNLSDALRLLGIEPMLVQGYPNNSQDFTPVVLAIRQSGAEIVGSYMTFEQDVGIFAKQLRQLGSNITWIGSPSNLATNALKLAGPALHGTFAVGDFTPDSSAAARTFANNYAAAYKIRADGYASWVYDAVKILALAVNKAGNLEPGNIRSAILGVNGYQGAVGTYRFDKYGDGLHGYNILRNDQGNIVFDRHIEFSD